MRILKNLFIFSISALSAFIVLNFVLFFYYKLPLHLNNPHKTTDYIWESNSSWIKMTEGISWGKMDSLGFNNGAVIENPDVLILGSSHMEATNVFQKYNTSNQLQHILKEANLPFQVYNRGISGHNFLKCCKYLKINSENTTAKYILIETSDIDFKKSDIQKLFDNKIEYVPSYCTGIIYYLQKMPFFRLVYSQIEHGLIDLFIPKKKSTFNEQNSTIKYGYEEAISIEEYYDKLFSFIVANANGKQVVIFYHPTGIPLANGKLEYSTQVKCLEAFQRFSEKYGVGFIDLTEETEKLWEIHHKTTHGFTTGTAFSGHINRYGHKIAAQKLADYIIHNEEKIDVAF